MKKNDYWRKREEDWIEQQILNDKKLMKHANELLDSAFKNILNEINSYYIRYAEKEHISLSEARKRISKFDVKSFEKRAKKIVESKDFSDYANNRLRIYNATMRINQLEYLKSMIGIELVDYSSQFEKFMTDKLSQAYLGELNRQAGILNSHRIYELRKNVNTVVNSSFLGANFSERIWANNDVLKSRLEQLLTKSLIQGVNPKVLSGQLTDLVRKEQNNARYAAERLLRTETARVQDQAQTDSFKKAGFEYVKWVAEPSACEQCTDIQAQNDGIYKIDKAPSIPIHPSCRCSKSAYVPSYEETKFLMKYSGALNDVNDPDFTRRESFATDFYNELRNSKRDKIVETISINSNLSKETVSRALTHILDSKYMLFDPETYETVLRRFDPSYDMAQSLQRLRLGKPEKHDIIMLKHEKLEAQLMNEKHILYELAHAIANQKYNYSALLQKWKEGMQK